jgi:hypothetical protein
MVKYYFSLLPSDLFPEQALYLDYWDTERFCSMLHFSNNIWDHKILFRMHRDKSGKKKLYDIFPNSTPHEIYRLMAYIEERDKKLLENYLRVISSTPTWENGKLYKAYCVRIRNIILDCMIDNDPYSIANNYMSIYDEAISILMEYLKGPDENVTIFCHLWKTYPQYRTQLSIMSLFNDNNTHDGIGEKCTEINNYVLQLTWKEAQCLKSAISQSYSNLSDLLRSIYRREHNVTNVM